MTDEERRECNRRYYAKHRTEIPGRMHRQRAADPEKARERKNRYRAEHPEQYREYDRRYREKNREEINRKRPEYENEKRLFFDAVKCRRSQHHCMTCGWNPRVKQQRKERSG